MLRHWNAFRAATGSVKSSSTSSFMDKPGITRAVPVVELLDELTDLTPARQVRATSGDIDPKEVAGRADDHLRRLVEQAGLLAEAARQGGWRSAGDGRREWRAAAVSDLARGSALEILRAGAAPQGGSGRGRPAEGERHRPVLTGTDIARGEHASAGLGELSAESSPVVEAGDVLLRIVRSCARSMTRVADEDDEGAVLGSLVVALRPDRSFLAGFMDAEDNLAGASTGSTTLQVQPGRLRVPLLPLADQRRYGEAFRRIRALRQAAQQSAELRPPRGGHPHRRPDSGRAAAIGEHLPHPLIEQRSGALHRSDRHRRENRTGGRAGKQLRSHDL